MLTIKHIRTNGVESVLQAHQVNCVPQSVHDRPDWPNSPHHAYVMLCDEVGDPRRSGINTIDSGTVYVMNHTGKTVATYHLHGELP